LALSTFSDSLGPFWMMLRAGGKRGEGKASKQLVSVRSSWDRGVVQAAWLS
jgi:hypothetical protein